MLVIRFFFAGPMSTAVIPLPMSVCIVLLVNMLALAT